MSDPIQPTYPNITVTDVQLASAYYPILIDLALRKHCLTYGELVQAGKRRYPTKLVVQRAIPVSTGRRLEVVRLYTVERNLPDLSSLIMNKDTGECGSTFHVYADAEQTRKEVFAFDWRGVPGDFDTFIEVQTRALTPRKKVTKAVALELMSQHYASHKDTLPRNVRQYREAIVEMIEEGFTAQEAFDLAIKGRKH
jgi:hypothetical protein